MSDEKVTELEMEQFHHCVILTNGDHPTHKMGIAFANEDDEILCYVPMTLADANKFGEAFCQRYNETLSKARGEQ